MYEYVDWIQKLPKSFIHEDRQMRDTMFWLEIPPKNSSPSFYELTASKRTSWNALAISHCFYYPEQHASWHPNALEY